MQTRPATTSDVANLLDIDGTIESTQYLHLERSGEGLSTGWKLDPRPLREKLIESNPLNDERQFLLKQIVMGADEGLALLVEIGDAPIAMALAQARPSDGTMDLLDLRVDYDIRRQGIGTVLIYQIMQHARDMGLRSVSVETRTSNLPANQMLHKLAFEIAGVDTHRHSNHDMVKEAATIFWYAAMD
jgi:ribosomal protein S18 acetylase RimI-like enzyme